MIKLQPCESILAGNLSVQGGRVRADIVCERIEWLISYKLRRITVHPNSEDGATLYEDPEDGRFWERTCPRADTRGGGQTLLRWLSSADVGEQYPQLLCPVCGFLLGCEAWEGQSASDEICPCCGIQFGYDDFVEGEVEERAAIHRRWRADWVEAGMPWRGARQAPAGWNPTKQVDRVNKG